MVNYEQYNNNSLNLIMYNNLNNNNNDVEDNNVNNENHDLYNEYHENNCMNKEDKKKHCNYEENFEMICINKEKHIQHLLFNSKNNNILYNGTTYNIINKNIKCNLFLSNYSNYSNYSINVTMMCHVKCCSECGYNPSCNIYCDGDIYDDIEENTYCLGYTKNNNIIYSILTYYLLINNLYNCNIEITKLNNNNILFKYLHEVVCSSVIPQLIKKIDNTILLYICEYL